MRRFRHVFSRESLVKFYLHGLNTAVPEMVSCHVTPLPRVDQRNLLAVRQVALVVGRSQRALLSDVVKKENTRLKSRLTRTTSKVVVVITSAPELTASHECKIKYNSHMYEEFSKINVATGLGAIPLTDKAAEPPEVL